MTNKLQSLPCKFCREFSVGCSDYLIILVQYGASIRHICLFKIHGTVAWVNWVVPQTLNQTWCSIIYFIKKDGCVKWHQMKFNELQHKLKYMIFCVSLLRRLIWWGRRKVFLRFFYLNLFKISLKYLSYIYKRKNVLIPKADEIVPKNVLKELYIS